jgi:hypothetical protein
MATALDMYRKGELLDPRSIVLIADIANTGSNHVTSWRKNYRPTTDRSSELAHVAASLKSNDSYWGNSENQNGKFTAAWTDRIQKTYEKLSGWSPSFAFDKTSLGLGNGECSYTLKDLINPQISKQETGLGFGPDTKTSSVTIKKMRTAPTQDYSHSSNYGLGFGEEKVNYTRTADKTDSLYNAYNDLQKAQASGVDTTILEKLMAKVVALLEGISDNTMSTADKLDLLKTLGVNSVPNNKNANNVIVQTSPNKGSTTSGSAMSMSEKVARSIALGKA